MKLNKAILFSGVAVLVSVTGLVASSTTASAYIACNRDGDCWHTDRRVTAPGVTFSWHPDDWYFHQTWTGSDRHWRDYHEGRGYYKGGVWITL